MAEHLHGYPRCETPAGTPCTSSDLHFDECKNHGALRVCEPSIVDGIPTGQYRCSHAQAAPAKKAAAKAKARPKKKAAARAKGRPKKAARRPTKKARPAARRKTAVRRGGARKGARKKK
jgi:hypothetical protein